MSPIAGPDTVETSIETLHNDPPSPGLVKMSAQYAEKYVTEDVHPAFADAGIRYNPDSDCFAAEIEDEYDDAALIDSQKAFVDALEQFQQGVKTKYESKVDLRAMHTWKEVMEYADEARDKYTGVSKKGIVRKIDQKLKTFQTAASAVEAWLKLLPSTSWYGSIICGGLTIVLEAAVNLRKLRKETLSALHRMPLCIEKAQFFMRTYGYPKIRRQVGDLYLAMIDALQHILEWYKCNAGMRYVAAFCKGPAYAERLRTKMKNVETASEAMEDQASQRQQLTLKMVKDVAVQTNDQVGELKILALEARNHLYDVLKDTELWQKAMHTWKDSRIAMESRTASRDQVTLEREASNTATEKALLACFSSEVDDYSRDMEHALGKVPLMTLGDQDRIAATIQHQKVQDWLLNPLLGGLLVNGNGRRYDPIAPTSVACALLIHLFSRKLLFPTVYWFCGLHTSGSNGNALGMLRGLIYQLLCLSCCRCSSRDQSKVDTQDLDKLLKLFRRLLRRSASRFPIVCILDGLSYYESRHQNKSTSKIVSELASQAKLNPPKLILLLTSPIRASYISRERDIVRDITIAEVPDHVSGVKQGLNSSELISDTENKARGLLERVINGQQAG